MPEGALGFSGRMLGCSRQCAPSVYRPTAEKPGNRETFKINTSDLFPRYRAWNTDWATPLPGQTSLAPPRTGGRRWPLAWDCPSPSL